MAKPGNARSVEPDDIVTRLRYVGDTAPAAAACRFGSHLELVARLASQALRDAVAVVAEERATEYGGETAPATRSERVSGPLTLPAGNRSQKMMQSP